VGRKAGLSDEKLRAVPGNDLTPLNDTERLVIELADALTETPSNVSDDLYARLPINFPKNN
jgi:alkylhydroperoxidase family enzyme